MPSNFSKPSKFCLPIAGVMALVVGAQVLPILNASYASTENIAREKQAVGMIFVSPFGADTNDGTQGQPLRTITAALRRNLPAGTVIQLVEGTYSAETGEVFPLRLTRGVILRGNTAVNGAGIVISGGGRFVSPTFGAQDVGILVENQARLEGVTVSNGNRRGYGVWLESTQGATIVNNTFTRNGHDGVFMTGTTRADIVGNIFTGNSANGISAVGSSSGVITGNTFDNTGFGVTVSQRSSVQISNNRILNNRGGIIVNNLATPTLRNNLIANSAESGLTILRDRAGHPVVDMGTTAQPGRNVFENNRTADITNATGAVLVAVGNQVDARRVVGQVELVASDVDITPPATPPVNQGLADVRGHWAERQITALAERNIIRGFIDGTFRPEEPVTRAQFAAILDAAFSQMGTVRPAQAFVDVPDTFWGHRAIAQSFARGFMSGFPSGEFRPAQQIPRVQVLVSLVSGSRLSGGDPARLSESFRDAAEIPNFALPAIASATHNRLVVNHPDPSQLAPNRPATRAEVAAMVFQLLTRQGVIR